MTEQHVEGSVRADDLGNRRLSLPVGNMKSTGALERGLTRPGAMGRTSLKHTSATGRRLGLSLARRRPWKPNNVNMKPTTLASCSGMVLKPVIKLKACVISLRTV